MNPDGTIDRTNKNECNLVKFSCTLNVRGAKIISICRKSCFFAKKRERKRYFNPTKKRNAAKSAKKFQCPSNKLAKSGKI